MTTGEKMESLKREFLETFPESEENCWSTNKAGIVGIIEEDFEFSHVVYGESFFKTFVTIYRFSGVVDHVPVILSEKKLCVPVYGGNYVKILGDFRSFNVHDEDGKSHLKLFLFGKQIVYNPSADMVNMIYLKGYICKPPIYRKTPTGGIDIADVLVAVNFSNGKSAYVPCIAWNGDARYAAKLQVGDSVQFWGRIQSRDYFKVLQDCPDGGEMRQAYEVSIIRIEKIDIF